MNFSTKAKQSAGPEAWQALFERASLPKSVYWGDFSCRFMIQLNQTEYLKVPLPLLPASQAFCKLFARDVHQTINNPKQKAKLIYTAVWTL